MSADPITGEKGEMAAEQIIWIPVSSNPTVPLKKKREKKHVCGGSNKRRICPPFITMSSSDACRYCLAGLGGLRINTAPGSGASPWCSRPSGVDRTVPGRHSAGGTGTNQGMLLHDVSDSESRHHHYPVRAQKIANPELQHSLIDSSE